jgi:predicted enzyme related to lactoylglutathione lyase
MAKRVTGIGGIFFKAKDPTKLGEWYTKHLDIEMEENMPMTTFSWRRAEDPQQNGSTIWSLMPKDTDYFGADEAQFMINYRVDDLDGLMDALKKEGVEILRPMFDTPYGRFAAIRDPEGNGIELWQPPDNQ